MKKRFSEKPIDPPSTKLMPLVSIIIPAYNVEKWVKLCVDSVLDQDYPNKEIIVVDDGSTDDTYKIAQPYESKGVRTFQKKNGGAPSARNFGAAQSTGQYLMFFDVDRKLKPGTLTKQITYLEAHPEHGFYYGGYQVCDDPTLDHPVGEYRSEEFDRYFLEQFNYIDSQALMRRECFDYAIEKQGGWDESLKSLQDWDLFLTITEKYTGHHSPELISATKMPVEGDISLDSHNNWLDRMDTVKKKHGLKNNDIVVTSLGAPHHGKKMAKILGADFRQFPQMKPNRYKMIYLLGFYPQAMENHAAIFQGSKAKRLIHWIGTDILQFQTMPYASALKFVEMMNREFPNQLTEVDWTQKEMETLGIKTKIVPLPILEDDKYVPTPMPEEFSVAVYMPEHHRDNYNAELIAEIMDVMPDVKFKVFGTASEVGEKKNVQFMGYIKDMKPFIESTSCVLRLMHHDGLPLGPCEWIMAGRHAIYNIEMPYVQHVPLNKHVIVDTIRKVRNLKPAPGGPEHYRKWLDKDKYRKAIRKFL